MLAKELKLTGQTLHSKSSYSNPLKISNFSNSFHLFLDLFFPYYLLPFYFQRERGALCDRRVPVTSSTLVLARQRMVGWFTLFLGYSPWKVPSNANITLYPLLTNRWFSRYVTEFIQPILTAITFSPLYLIESCGSFSSCFYELTVAEWNFFDENQVESDVKRSNAPCETLCGDSGCRCVSEGPLDANDHLQVVSELGHIITCLCGNYQVRPTWFMCSIWITKYQKHNLNWNILEIIAWSLFICFIYSFLILWK